MNEFHKLMAEERLNQDRKWGEQNHDAMTWLGILAEEFGELAKAVNEEHFRPDEFTRLDLLNELVQTATVCEVFFESGKRNGWL